MKTSEQIDAQVAALKSVQPRVRKLSAFGDNNQEAVAAQIEVLEQRLTDDQVYDRFDRSGISEHVRDAAIQAADWMQDRLADDGEVLAADWESIATPAEKFDPYSGR